MVELVETTLKGFIMTDLEKAREFFGGDLYATDATGIVIDEIGDHFARCSLEITRKHQNAILISLIQFLLPAASISWAWQKAKNLFRNPARLKTAVPPAPTKLT